MTEQTEAAPDDRLEREVSFKGRDIWVCMPAPEKLVVWQRTLKQLQGADVEGWDGHQVMAAMGRVRNIVDSVILHKVDKDWLDDELLEGTVSLIEMAGLITQTVEAFGTPDNRKGRRAAAKKATTPAKKAARKAAPRSPR